MDLNRLFQETLSSELSRFKKTQEDKLEILKKNKAKLNNADIQRGLVEIIGSTNILLSTFVESVLKNRDKVFHDELVALTEILRLQTEIEKLDLVFEAKKKEYEEAEMEYLLMKEAMR